MTDECCAAAVQTRTKRFVFILMRRGTLRQTANETKNTEERKRGTNPGHGAPVYYQFIIVINLN